MVTDISHSLSLMTRQGCPLPEPENGGPAECRGDAGIDRGHAKHRRESLSNATQCVLSLHP